MACTCVFFVSKTLLYYIVYIGMQCSSYLIKFIHIIMIAMKSHRVFERLFATRCAMRDARCAMRDARCAMRDARCAMRDARCAMRDARCAMRDARCAMRDARCAMHTMS